MLINPWVSKGTKVFTGENPPRSSEKIQLIDLQKAAAAAAAAHDSLGPASVLLIDEMNLNRKLIQNLQSLASTYNHPTTHTDKPSHPAAPSSATLPGVLRPGRIDMGGWQTIAAKSSPEVRRSSRSESALGFLAGCFFGVGKGVKRG